MVLKTFPTGVAERPQKFEAGAGAVGVEEVEVELNLAFVHLSALVDSPMELLAAQPLEHKESYMNQSWELPTVRQGLLLGKVEP